MQIRSTIPVNNFGKIILIYTNNKKGKELNLVKELSISCLLDEY
jgi:hypothetical protein